MRNLMFFVVACVLLPLAAVAEGRLTVAGEARVAAQPDMATLTLGALGRGKTAAEAMNETSVAVEAILARLAALGVAQRDVQTTQLRLREDTRWDQSRNEDVFMGYVARNTVEVRIRDLDGIGALLAAVLDDGANELQNLYFGLQNPRKVEDEARRRAVADARSRAELYAEAAGVTLGALVSLRDTAEPLVPSVMPAEPVIVEAAMASEDVPVAAGEIVVRAEVTLVYAIGE